MVTIIILTIIGKDDIFIHTAKNVLSKNLWNKNKSQKKKPHLEI